MLHLMSAAVHFLCYLMRHSLVYLVLNPAKSEVARIRPQGEERLLAQSKEQTSTSVQSEIMEN